MAFQPKQITQYQAEHLAELQGTASDQAIQSIMGSIPAFSAGDVIHDNACGAGAVTQAIMAIESLPPSIHIDATDINPQFVQGVAAMAEKNGWPVSTAVMAAQELTFPDDRFTHSLSTFAFHCIGDEVRAAAQIYRTLKPGGTAVASTWSSMPHVQALQHAHWRTRGRDGPMPVLLPLEHTYGEAQLRAALETGGFAAENIRFTDTDCYVTISDMKRWAQLAWSYLGPLPTGWLESDEEKWDEALEAIVEHLQSGDGISKNDKGETVLKMVASMAIATK